MSKMHFLKSRISNTSNWIIVVLILVLLKVSTADADCNCTCQNGSSPCDLFETVSHIKTEMKLFENHILQLVSQQHQLRNLNNKLAVNQDKVKKLEQQLKELKEASFHTTTPASIPIAEPLINLPGDYTEVSSEKETLDDGYQEFASLRAKVEVVKNMTLEVQEELESERRVRRHIQENLDETQTYIRLLDTKLQNVTIPVDNRMNQIEEEVILKLENLNKTIVEDYLKKMEYKINDVVYKNETRQLDNRLEEIEHQILDPENSTFVSKVESELKTFSKLLDNLNGSIEEKIIVSEYRLLETIDNNFKNELQSFRNESNSLRIDMLSLRNDFEEIQNETKTITEIVSENKEKLFEISQEASTLSNQVSFAFGELDDMKIEFAGLQKKISTAANITAIDHRDGKSEIKNNLPDLETPCLLPNMTDSKLLVKMKYDVNGTQRLIFGCHPIGLYALVDSEAPMKCKKRTWQGKFPHCVQLLDEMEIGSLSWKIFASISEIGDPCFLPRGQFPNPLDCNTFFNCWDGANFLQKCPPNQYFNPNSGKCDYKHSVQCIHSTDSVIEEVINLIPSVVLPNSLDKISGLMGTGASGELVVYPGTNFELKCLFPEGPWAKPKWTIKTEDTFNSHAKSSIFGNSVSINLWSVKTTDTGVYSCVSPFSQENSIRVVVKAIQCPEIEQGQIPTGVTVFYRSHPEGHIRSLGTQIQYQCDRNKHFFNGFCRATGQWSRKLPNPNECESREAYMMDEQYEIVCPPIDTSHHPGLLPIEETAPGETVAFKCAEPLELDGNIYNICLSNGTWLYDDLPTCSLDY